MRIVVAGCGRVGRDLAREFADGGHDVSVIDLRPEALAQLGSTFDGTLHEGTAYAPRVLREAGISEADVFLAVTNSDNANLMAVEVAKALFSVPRAIARLDDPARADAYKALDIAHVPASQLVARIIFEQVIEEEFEFHVTFPAGDVEIVEMTLGPRAEDLRVIDFEVPGRLRVAAVRHDGETVVPKHDYVMAPGDLVVAAVRAGVRSDVVRFLRDEPGED